MDLERYEYLTIRTYKEYEFYSEGPKGRIRKAVRFRLMPAKGGLCYNLNFGDWNEETESVNHYSVTNNGDAEKVLATVAAIVLNFMTIFPEAWVYAEGSSMARTRRYQMGINKLWHEIEKIADVYGATGNAWEPFQKNITYYAFLITRKEWIDLQEETEYYMTSSTKNTANKKKQYNDRVVDNMRDYSNEPFFNEKDEQARKRLERIGLPKELLEKKYGKP